ncbi:agmatinase [Amylibacter kogurei]|uniref:Agmatinase n=1 Tax=Paramylibacter kogurei TaxID=1889778 RepID=A0A2G5K5E1_9RHOB|nr:agmatinase [Amylibacter kogurei]PIB24100.1 agmatinase [Amylibacter kogurei]
MTTKGDFAFRSNENLGRSDDRTYSGVLSFLRRRYTRELNDVDVVVSGVPYDCSVTNRSGCRFGPRAIREASTQLAELDAFPFGFFPFDTLAVTDYGDCYMDPHHPETIADTIADHAREILKSDAKMLTLGGDHFIAYPLLKAHAEKYGPIALVQFDAHCDTWPDDGKQLDHGTMFARAAADGIIDTTKSTQIGLRTYNDTDAGFEILTAPWVHRNGIDAALDIIKKRAGDAPVYISFDIDGFDPAFAPGTGTPVVGGLASWQGLELIRGMGDLNLIGMDVVEVAPAYDHGEITALAAATVAHDWLCLLAQKKGAKGHVIGRI